MPKYHVLIKETEVYRVMVDTEDECEHEAIEKAYELMDKDKDKYYDGNDIDVRAFLVTHE